MSRHMSDWREYYFWISQDDDEDYSAWGVSMLWGIVVALMVLGIHHHRTTLRMRMMVKMRKIRKRQDDIAHDRHSSDSKTLVIDNERQKRKQHFLQQPHVQASYGYPQNQSSLGFIDDWRPQQLPGLIPPLSHHNDKPSPESKATSESESSPIVYLDYAGAALPHAHQLHQILQLQNNTIWANPHSSAGPAASATLAHIEHIKQQLLQLWNGLPGKKYASLSTTEQQQQQQQQQQQHVNSAAISDYHLGYELIFTSGATQALEIVSKQFPWTKQSTLLYAMNSHTSVLGMRQAVLQQGGKFCAVDCHGNNSEDEDWADKIRDAHSDGPNLMVLPLECNFSGARTDVCKIQKLARTQPSQDKLQNRLCWYTMIDLAKAVCTSPVNLRELDPDFACLSFYKIWGEPTGLGCLLVKRSVLSLLQTTATNSTTSSPIVQHPPRHYFGGGSVNVVLPRQDYVQPRDSPAMWMTHGTTHFRGIVALTAGLQSMERLGGMEAIQRHTHVLWCELMTRLEKLEHVNGQRVIEFYTKRPSNYVGEMSFHHNGPTVAFNVLRSDGSFVGYSEVIKLASLNCPPIQLRGGCFCNPGACQKALNKSDNDIIEQYSQTGHVCGDDIDLVNGQPTGALRASLGKDSIWEDVDELVSFLDKTFVSKESSCERREAWDGQPRNVLLTELYIYPIKSCSAQRVSKWPLESDSLRPLLDREFALVDSFGTAMRLQRYPAMAFIHPVVDWERRIMTVDAPGQDTLTIALDDYQRSSYEEGQISVCGNKCGGILWGDESVSQWFSDYMGVQCWLARHSLIKEQERYKVSPAVSLPSRTSLVAVPKAFANEQPLLLISEHAVDLLNEILVAQGKSTVTSRNFRPNLVVRLAGGAAPQSVNHHTEDGWSVIRIISGDDQSDSSVEFVVTGPCARCSMVDVDPSSGSKDGNALRALADYRRSNGQINFGIFLQKRKNDHENSKDLRSHICSNHERTNFVWLKEGDILHCE